MRILGGPVLANQGDFFTLSCRDVPDNASIVFRSTVGSATVTPHLVRPHLVFVSFLSSVTPGAYRVHLEAAGASSNEVDVTVAAPSAGGTTTVLNAGASKAEPLTIAFIANPAVVKVDRTIVADPIMRSRASFNNTVSFCLRTLFSFREDLLYAGGIDAEMRLVAIFDPPPTVSAAEALVEEYLPDPDQELMAPRRDEIAAYLAGRGITADVAFAIHDWKDRQRASAFFTNDDLSAGTLDATYDGVTVRHGLRTAKPGTIALWSWEGVEAARRAGVAGRLGITPLHEFCHAASAYGVGLITDLYDDDLNGNGERLVNKKGRTSSAIPIPARFGEYATIDHNSDMAPQGIIPLVSQDRRAWRSYRPEKVDSMPVVMDNYWFAPDARMCIHDELTRAFLNDRIRAKLSR